MKIIKQGDINSLKEPKIFECNKCGCVFEADSSEYITGTQYNETWCYCHCPTCGNACFAERTKRIQL